MASRLHALHDNDIERHKLDRKIEAEEHWMRYGVIARRKRNMRRVAGLQALRRSRRDGRRAADTVAMSAAVAERSSSSVDVRADADNLAKARSDARLEASPHRRA
jgi:ATP-binding cassette subfamily F protein uup